MEVRLKILLVINFLDLLCSFHPLLLALFIYLFIFCAKWAAKQNKYCTKHFLLRIDLHNFCISFISRFYTPKRNARQSWILHSMLWIPDSRYWITVFLRIVRGTPDSLSCIPDSKGFPGFYISPLELPRFLDAWFRNFPDSGIWIPLCPLLHGANLYIQ